MAGHTDVPPGFVDMVLVSGSRTRLVVQAPKGRVRWTFDGRTCSVGAKWIGKAGGGGFGGAGCEGDAYLSSGGGMLGDSGALFDVVAGRTIPTAGVTVEVVLAGGATAVLEPKDGLWMAVVQRCGAYADTRISKLVVHDENGNVLAVKRFGPEPHPISC